MSGAGRKHRAKHLTRQYLDDDAWSGPTGSEQLAVSTGSPSGKHLHVLMLTPPQDTATSSGVGSTTESAVDEDATISLYYTPAVVHLPGKFHKVMWIAAKDVLVVIDNVIERKLSPAQLENFLLAQPAWKTPIAAAVRKTEEGRQLKGAPTVGFAPSGTTQVGPVPLQSELQSSAVRDNVTAAEEGSIGGLEDDHETEDAASEEDALENPNRNSIKHRKAMFLDDEEEEEEDEEEDDE